MPKPARRAQPSKVKAALSAPPRRAARLELHPVDDGYLVHQAGGAALHRLNPSAALVLELCDGRRTPAQIADLVKGAWGLARRPQAEVEAILKEMALQGLVSGVPAASGKAAARRR